MSLRSIKVTNAFSAQRGILEFMSWELMGQSAAGDVVHLPFRERIDAFSVQVFEAAEK